MSQKTKCRGSGTRRRAFVSALAMMLSASIAIAQSPQVPRLEHGWCRYPSHDRLSKAAAQNKLAVRARVVGLAEIESNGDPAWAQLLAPSSTIGDEVDVTVAGSISDGADVDYYRFFANKGDVIGMTVTTYREPFETQPDVGLNPTVAICDPTGEPYCMNDNDYVLAQGYPSGSPLPVVANPLNWLDHRDSALSWIADETGDYLVRVEAFVGASRGDYELKLVLRRPSMEVQPVGATQIFYLDFDGVYGLNAMAAFGEGYFLTDLSPLRDFLPDWGLTAADEPAVIDAILAVFTQHFDSVRSAALNGDRDADSVDGHMDFEVRNSRDHVDPWGQPNVTRVIVGGTIAELGIPTIGIASSIDPGNFSREDTAVVLLDLLSLPDPGDPNSPWYPVFLGNSINAIPRAGNFTMVDAIGQTVGTVAAHEACHMLGLWHTDNTNPVLSLIDQGGVEISVDAGAGPDGVLGTGDDQLPELVPDMYSPDEYTLDDALPNNFVLTVAQGLEFTNVRVAFALATGQGEGAPPPSGGEDAPMVSISAMPKVGQAPLGVDFAGGGIDPAGGQFVVFNWSFGDGATGTGAFVTHTYTKPGTYIVTLSGTTSNAVTAQAATEVRVLSEPNELPVARIIASPKKGDAPLMVLFQADAEDPDGEIIGYAWDFGDGETGTGAVIDHVFVTPGIYVVTLSVTDTIGAVQRVTTAITVLGEQAGGLNNDAPQGDSGLRIPTLNGCGAGAPSALLATLAGLMGMALIRRRY